MFEQSKNDDETTSKSLSDKSQIFLRGINSCIVAYLSNSITFLKHTFIQAKYVCSIKKSSVTYLVFLSSVGHRCLEFQILLFLGTDLSKANIDNTSKIIGKKTTPKCYLQLITKNSQFLKLNKKKK